jgi:hypothetical protein
VAQWVRSLDLTAHASLSPIRRGFAPGCVDYKKGCTRLGAASDSLPVACPWSVEWRIYWGLVWSIITLLITITGFSGVKCFESVQLNYLSLLLWIWLIFWCLSPLSAVMATSFSGGRSRCTWREPPTMGKQLVNYHLRLLVECTPFCNQHSRARTHAVLAIGLHELLGNPTTTWALYCGLVLESHC